MVVLGGGGTGGGTVADHDGDGAVTVGLGQMGPVGEACGGVDPFLHGRPVLGGPRAQEDGLTGELVGVPEGLPVDRLRQVGNVDGGGGGGHGRWRKEER